MSSVRLSGNAGGTGIFTIASPNSNSSPTMTLPDATTTLVGTDATQSFTNKSFDSASVPTVSGTAPLSFCRAWVNFNGTGTVAIRASGNVTSITDRGTGAYTVNFTTAMPDANYSALGTASRSGAETQLVVSISTAVAPTASAVAIQTYRSSDAGVEDSPNVNVSVFR